MNGEAQRTLSDFDEEEQAQEAGRWFYGGTPPPEAERLGYPFVGAVKSSVAPDRHLNGH